MLPALLSVKPHDPPPRRSGKETEMSYCPVAAAEARYNDGRFEYAVEAEVEAILKDEDEIAEIAGAVLF